MTRFDSFNFDPSLGPFMHRFIQTPLGSLGIFRDPLGSFGIFRDPLGSFGIEPSSLGLDGFFRTL